MKARSVGLKASTRGGNNISFVARRWLRDETMAVVTSLRNYELLPVWKQRTQARGESGATRGGAAAAAPTDEFMIGTRQASQMLPLPELWSTAFLTPISSG